MNTNFKTNDLVFAVYDNIGEGTIYRVEEISSANVLKLKPIFCIQGPEYLKKRRDRTLGAGWARKVTTEDLKDMLSNLDNLLKEIEDHNENK